MKRLALLLPLLALATGGCLNVPPSGPVYCVSDIVYHDSGWATIQSFVVTDDLQCTCLRSSPWEKEERLYRFTIPHRLFRELQEGVKWETHGTTNRFDRYIDNWRQTEPPPVAELRRCAEEAFDRRAFRELDDELKMDMLHERWLIVVEHRKEEARLQAQVREFRKLLSGKEPDADGTPDEAGRSGERTEDVLDEEFPLRARIKTVPESERDSFLEDAWVEYCAEDRRLQASICILQEQLSVFPADPDSVEDSVESEPHAEGAENAETRPGKAGPLPEGAAERSEAGGVSHAESAEGAKEPAP